MRRHLPVPGIGAALAAAGMTLLTQEPATARSDRTPPAARDGGGWPDRRRCGAGADGIARRSHPVLAVAGWRHCFRRFTWRSFVATRSSGSLPELIERAPGTRDRGANFVCITGPSRTADIEHVLSRGVHGPRDVHVVLI